MLFIFFNKRLSRWKIFQPKHGEASGLSALKKKKVYTLSTELPMVIFKERVCWIFSSKRLLSWPLGYLKHRGQKQNEMFWNHRSDNFTHITSPWKSPVFSILISVWYRFSTFENLCRTKTQFSLISSLRHFEWNHEENYKDVFALIK